MSTENQLFDSFKAEHVDDGVRWREWWRRHWMDQIDDYYDRGWKLIPCGKFNKRPMAGWSWSKKSLQVDETTWYAAQGYNIAVVLDDKVVLDYDTESTKPFDTGTLTMKTAKGYQYWCSGPVHAEDWRLRSKLISSGFDKTAPFRTGVMYSLAPLSRTCKFDFGGKDNCLVHTNIIREWVNFGAELKPVRQVVRDIA